MTKSTLLSWYGKDISYNERNILHKVGVGDYDYHYLQDLKQILFCEDKANSLYTIKSKLSGKRIRKIFFFTPNFNDSKPDASNYSCAIVETENNGRWVISYRPSYVSNIQDDIFVKKLDISTSKAESKLNGEFPISAVALSDEIESFFPSSLIIEPFVRINSLPSDARNNPDKYILPLELKMRSQSSKLDELTSSYSYEKAKIEQYIQEAESNRSYTRSKYQIEQEKFQERIETYPKDWCRVS